MTPADAHFFKLLSPQTQKKKKDFISREVDSAQQKIVLKSEQLDVTLNPKTFWF